MNLSCFLIPNEEYGYEMEYHYIAADPKDYEYIEDCGIMLGKKLKKLAKDADEFHITDNDTTWVMYFEKSRPNAMEMITIRVNLCNFTGELKLLRH